MMHLAYPNVIDRHFRGCVRYLSTLQNPDPSVYTSTSDSPPNTPNLATLRAVTHRLAPEWSAQGGYKVRIYEKADVRGTWQGSSLDLAYLLASIRGVRSLRLEALVDAGDVWCTGAIGALDSGAPRLRAVAPAEFTAKLAGFVAQPHDRFFLVPAANIHTQLYELCDTHDVQVLPLSDFQQCLPAVVTAGQWAGQAVILIEEDQLQDLVATLFAPPLSSPEPTDHKSTPEPMLRRPYKFLAAFERDDADLFYGRAREIRRLQSLLPMARILILHGASGTGKTSLLQAGLLPRLPPARYAAVLVRVVDDEPRRAIKAALLRAFGMEPRYLDLPLLDVLTTTTTAVGKVVVVILDQFEEFFLRFPPVVRQGLQQELGACVTAAPLAVHFVIALREDYFSHLAEFQDTIPTLFTHTMRLTRLPVARAFDAVVEPARRLGITVDEALIREILLPQLADVEGCIDPPLLQLVCDALYQQAQDAGRTAIGQAEYTALGDVRAVLRAYLEATLQQFGPDQSQVREVLKALVTAEGTTKRTVFIEDLLSRLHTAGVRLPAEALERLLLRRLVHRRLVRVDEVEGRARYELIHEFLVPSIAEWMTADDRTPLAAKELIEQAYEGFQRTGLLLERAALQWIAPYADRLDLPSEQQEFLARSKQEAGRQRRRVWLRVGTLLLLVGLGVGGFLSMRANRKLQQAIQRANQHLAQALIEKGTPLSAQGDVLAGYILGAKALMLDPTSARARSLAYLSAMSVPYVCKDILIGHEETVQSVAFSPDGRLLASAARDGIRLWELPTGQLRATLSGHEDAVQSVAFSPDGRTLASGAKDRTIRLWELPTGQLRATLSGHEGQVLNVAFSPDGRTLAAAAWDGTIWLWELPTGQPLPTLSNYEEGPGYTRIVTSVAFSPDGRTLAAAAWDGTIRLWELPTGQLRATLSGFEGNSMHVAFSPDGHTLAAGGQDGIRLWELPTGQPLPTLSAYGAGEVAFSPDGQTLAAATADGIWLWERPTGRPRATLLGHEAGVRSVAFSPDGRTLAAGAADGTIRLWELPTDLPRWATLPSHTVEIASVVGVAFSPDGRTLAAGAADGTIRLWELPTGQLQATLLGHTQDVGSVAFSPDGRTLASGAREETIRLWELPTGQLRATLSGHTVEVWSVAFSPDGRTLASGSKDKTIRLWEVPTGQLRATLLGHEDTVASVAFSPDGRTLASAAWDGTIRLWEVPTGQLRATLSSHEEGLGHRGLAASVAFSPDGRLLASAAWDGTIRLWELPTGQLRATLSGHEETVQSVAFSPDGRLLASAAGDRTIRLWELPTGQLRATLPDYSWPGTRVAFSPDGRLLASAAADGTIQLWPQAFFSVRPELLYRQAQRDTGMRVEGLAVQLLGIAEWRTLTQNTEYKSP